MTTGAEPPREPQKTTASLPNASPWSRFLAWVWAPCPETAPPSYKAARQILRVLLIFAREFDRDRIPLRASALTFTIVLSLVPTLALGTAVLKGLGAGDQARLAAYRFIDQMVTSPVFFDGEDVEMELPAQGAPEEPQSQNMAVHLRRAVDQIFDYVDRTDFSTLGTFGIIGLVLAMITVLGSIETSMNAIWQAPSGRPLGRKVMDYLALMILLPVAINLTMAMEAMLQSEALKQRLITYLPFNHQLLKLMPLAILVGTFTILYRFLPNSRVKFLPAFIGGLFGGSLWLLTQGVYLKLQIGVARYNAIYGSFATLPLFLLWLQVGWIVFLSGAEMSFACQNVRTYRWRKSDPEPVAMLAMAYAVLLAVRERMRERQVATVGHLAEVIGEPEETVASLARRLARHGFLRPVESDEPAFVLGTTPEELDPAEVVEVIFGRAVPMVDGSALATAALEAAKTAVRGKRLAG